jgi:putative phosphoesterase
MVGVIFLFLVFMKIGLISDTHSYLDPKVFGHFTSCDEIWHAGDIGTMGLADELAKFRPLRAVYGNIDDGDLQARFPENLWIEIEGVSVLMTHIGGSPPNYNPRVKRLLKEKIPHMFICGHSHILRIKRDAALNNMLYVNPGAAGQHGFHTMKTIVRFEIASKEIRNMEVIELGKRAALT